MFGFVYYMDQLFNDNLFMLQGFVNITNSKFICRGIRSFDKYSRMRSNLFLCQGCIGYT